MRINHFLVYMIVFLNTAVVGADLNEVIAHPQKYDQQRVDLVGIARVTGEFFLFADAGTAADINSDVSKALYVRQETPGQPDYSDLDRQWVRLSGIVKAGTHGIGGSPAEILLEHAQKLPDRPAPQIKDPDVWGFFHNDTNQELRVEVPGGGFWIGPGKSNDVVIYEGPIMVFTLKPKANAPPWDCDKDKQIASGEVRFGTLAADYQYSPAHSDKRTFYYRITAGKIERVSAEQGKTWRAKETKKADSQK